jgi:lipoprotein-anchoring transpeptidase ErfK/SrfK
MQFVFARTLRVCAGFAVVAFASVTPVVSSPAEAQLFDFFGPSTARSNLGQRPIAPRRLEATRKREVGRTRKARQKEERSRAQTAGRQTPISGPPDPLIAVVSLSSQRMQVYDQSGRIADTRVSTGQAGHRTPAGIFSIIQRNRHHRSNIYSNAPMPWMQRLTWSGIALHAGVVPNYPASHGCIRLPYDFAPRMWSLARMGTRVVVSPTDVAPVEIAHPNLPVAVLTPVLASEIGPAVRMASAGEPRADVLEHALDPYRFAQVRRARAASELAAAERAAKSALEHARETSEEATRASEVLRRAQAAVAARGDEPPTGPATGSAESDQQLQGVAPADVELRTALRTLADAKELDTTASDRAFRAARHYRESEAAIDRASDAVRMSAWSSEPVSVFVSRKDGRVYVRQSFNDIHEEPIAIREPDRPLGTHVFTAIASKDGGSDLRWLALTYPTGRTSDVDDEAPVRRKGRHAAAEAPGRRSGAEPSSAADALSRIELPPATRKLVQERLWPGASLIISDQAASNETGRGTDFIVQPR